MNQDTQDNLMEALLEWRDAGGSIHEVALAISELVREEIREAAAKAPQSEPANTKGDGMNIQSEVSAGVSDSDPLMVAWKAYTQTVEYDNSKRWAQAFVLCNTRDEPEQLTVKHHSLEGSLWALFVAGWYARAALSKVSDPLKPQQSEL